MEIAFEQESWITTPALPGGTSTSQHPEWHGLRARLMASRQAWSALKTDLSGDLMGACGSFDEATAKLLDVFDARLAGVNLKDSSDLKPDGAMNAHVAGTSNFGGRG